jgi:glutathione S-transferase
MKLYGHYISVTTLQVMALLASKQSPVRLSLVDVFTGKQQQPAHLALHPFGHIPVLEDGDFQLYETHAILRYLDVKLPGGAHIPSDLRERAQMDQWLCIEQNYLMPAAKKVMARDYAKMMHLADPGAAIVEEGKRKLAFALDQFAQWIADKRHVAGGKPSLADLCWWADLHNMAAMPLASSPIEDPRIRSWWARMSDVEEWHGAIAELASYGPKEPVANS